AYYRFASTSNLSVFNNSGDVEKAVLSWKLIEFYFQLKFGSNDNAFMKNAKNGLYLNLRNSFPDFIPMNNDFFQAQINDQRLNKTFLFRASRKISKIFRK